MNYFAVHVQSNTIYKVIASSSVPADTEATRFVPASDGRVNQFLERVKWDKPISLYSIIPKPKIREILALTADDRTSLIEYILKCRHRETVERMAWVWRVSERTVREVLEDF